MSYDAALFDMDGVIVDTRQSVTEFWTNLSRAYHVVLSEEDLRQFVYGCPPARTFDALFPQLTPSLREATLAQMADYEIHLTYTEIPGAAALILAMQRAGIATALVTSGEQWKVDAVLGQLGLSGAFAAHVTAGDVERGKPDPDGYVLAAQRLGKQAGRCIVFEDSVSGVQAAVAAGALCIGIGAGPAVPPLAQSGASYVVPDLRGARVIVEAHTQAVAGLQVDPGAPVLYIARSLEIG